MSKTIIISIPENETIPEIIPTFSLEENYLMLKIGSECLREARNAVAGLSQKELYNKIKAESREEVQKLELDLVVQREMAKQMEVKISKIYEGQVEQMKKQMDSMRDQLKVYESENNKIFENEINKAREKYELLLEEKDKQNQLNRESFQAALQLTTMTAAKKGSKGEKKFREIAYTFTDFNEFEIQDKHTQAGEGDFHLHFEDFDVLVDAKNYKEKVGKTQRDKIKKDLLQNEHITFAWLVSLNTKIDKFDKAPIMHEWITTKKCIVYVNELLSFEEPEKFLRIAWIFSNQLYKFVEKNVENDVFEVTELKENRFKINDKLKNLRTIIREMNTSLNNLKKQIDTIDYEIKDTMNIGSNEVIESNFSLFDDWWENKIETTTEECELNSTDLWYYFKQENKEVVSEFDIKSDHFKSYIMAKVPANSRMVKSKKGSILIKHIKMKVNENNPVEEKMVVELISKPEVKEKQIKNTKKK